MLRDEVLGTCVRGARVVLGVAPDVLDLAAVDAARGVDRLHVGAHGVALDRRVDRATDVEEAADRDRTAADAGLRLAGRPGAAGGRGGTAA